MKRNLPDTDDSWENDAVWKLLDQASSVTSSARFTDDVVRAARLDVSEKSWWQRLLSPAPLAGFAAATAALALALVSLTGPSTEMSSQAALLDSAQAEEIQEIAETETLIAAVDHLDDFSDTELVSLIGF